MRTGKYSFTKKHWLSSSIGNFQRITDTCFSEGAKGALLFHASKLSLFTVGKGFNYNLQPLQLRSQS